MLVERVEQPKRIVPDGLADLVGKRIEEVLRGANAGEGLMEVADVGDVEVLGDAGIEARRELAGAREAKNDVIHVAFVREFLLGDVRVQAFELDADGGRERVTDEGTGQLELGHGFTFLIVVESSFSSGNHCLGAVVRRGLVGLVRVHE